ncbi:MAG: hypothetical protein NE328_10605 [Lentisphaeraceae bacterium]|nr:hypothetical protein [Lentisphaeraceae bacterium]
MISSKGRKIQGTTQGLYAGTPDGMLLGSTNNRSHKVVLNMLKKALKEFKPTDTKAITPSENSGHWNPNLKYPEGGFCARVNGKVMGGYEESDNRWQKLAQQSISRDNLWATKKEHDSLAQGTILPSLQKRIARFHLVDNTRGEPPMWKEEEIVSLSMTIKDGIITGSVNLKSTDGSRTYEANILGYIDFKDGRISRFDLIASGMFFGQGRFTKGAPKGKFPYAVSISLADGSDMADGIPPQGSRGWVPNYIDYK